MSIQIILPVGYSTIPFLFIPCITYSALLVVGFTAGLDDLVDQTKLDNVHDQGEDGHDENNLDRGREVLEHVVAQMKKKVGDARKREWEKDEEFHYDDGKHVGE